MATLLGTQTDLNELLKKLMQLDFDALEAYDSAIRLLRNEEYRARFGSFRDDHLRHTIELGKVLRDSGREPPHGGDLKRVLTQGKVLLAGLSGDRAVLKAMKANEDDTTQAYERAVSNDVVPARMRDVLRACLADERRHRAYIEEELEEGEPPLPRGGPSL